MTLVFRTSAEYHSIRICIAGLKSTTPALVQVHFFLPQLARPENKLNAFVLAWYKCVVCYV